MNITDDEFDFEWPSSNDRVFSAGHPLWDIIAKDADERNYHMTSGYQIAGDCLVEEIQRNPYLYRKLIYPTIFNYRHSIELSLKYLINTYKDLASVPTETNIHKLSPLWSSCKKIFDSLDGEEGSLDGPNAITALLNEFNKFDPCAVNCRYSYETNGEPIDISLKNIDVDNLRRVVSKINFALECIDTQLHHKYVDCDVLEQSRT